MHCPPPSFADLGKSASDLPDYGFCSPGFVGVEAKTRSSTGVETGATGSQDLSSGDTRAELETSWTSKNGKVNLTKKWNSDKILEAGVNLDNCLVEGLKLSLSKSLAVDSMERSAAASVSYVRPNVHFAASSDLSFPLSKPVVNASAVMLNQGWVLGAEALLDTATQRLTGATVALGYRANDVFLLHSRINAFEWVVKSNESASKINGSIFQFVNKNLKTGLSFSWDGEADTRQNLSYNVAAQYHFHRDASVSTRVDHLGQIGVGLRFLLFPGVNLGFGLDVNAKNFDAGGHKVGANIQFE